MIVAFLGGPVGPKPTEEVFSFYRRVKSILFTYGFLCICPMDISESLYRDFGDNTSVWKSLSKALLAGVDIAIFVEESPSGTLQGSKGSQEEIELCLKRGIPVLICECKTVTHPQDIVFKQLMREAKP